MAWALFPRLEFHYQSCPVPGSKCCYFVKGLKVKVKNVKVF